MSMMSSFRADRQCAGRLGRFARSASTLAVGALLWQCGVTAFGALQIPPDAPRPARLQPPREGSKGASYPRASVELKGVVVRPLDDEMRALAGAAFLKQASDPLFIQVQTERPLGNLERSAAPVILLNGEKLLDTRATAQDRLVAFLPDRKKLKDVNTVEVVWSGNRGTRTKKPLSFRLQDVGR